MSDIELKVGQVWKDECSGIPRDKEVIKLTKRMVYYFSENGINHSVRCTSKEEFIKIHTLITTADGEPYVKPNDYQHGDVWDLSDCGYNEAIIITTHEGELKFVSASRSGRANPVSAISSLITHPQQCRLIYRDGKVVAND